MSVEESELIISLLEGSTSLFEDGHIEQMHYMYFAGAVMSPFMQEDIFPLVGGKDKFAELAAPRLEEVIPHIIDRLKGNQRALSSDFDVALIIRGCKLCGWELDKFIGRTELAQLRHDVLLRSALHWKEEFATSSRNLARAAIAAASIAGITSEEMGLEQAFVDQCIDQYYHRNNPELTAPWKAAQEEMNFLATELQVH